MRNVLFILTVGNLCRFNLWWRLVSGVDFVLTLLADCESDSLP